MSAARFVKNVWIDLRSELLRFLVNQVGASVAEDLLQDIFARLLGREDALSDKSSPRAWLYKVARHAVIDHWRRRRETVELPADLADMGVPFEERIQTKLAACLRPLIEGLPAVCAEPLRLTELEGRSQAEAARLLGISVPALKSRVRRGRARLRAVLMECCEFEFSRTGRVLDYRVRGTCCVADHRMPEGSRAQSAQSLRVTRRDVVPRTDRLTSRS